MHKMKCKDIDGEKKMTAFPPGAAVCSVGGKESKNTRGDGTNHTERKRGSHTIHGMLWGQGLEA